MGCDIRGDLGSCTEGESTIEFYGSGFGALVCTKYVFSLILNDEEKSEVNLYRYLQLDPSIVSSKDTSFTIIPGSQAGLTSSHNYGRNTRFPTQDT